MRLVHNIALTVFFVDELQFDTFRTEAGLNRLLFWPQIYEES